jgi:N-acetyl-anhydromuramyl-L-alanine amidase AmpD
MFEFVLFAMSVFMALVPGFLFYKMILEEPIKEWLQNRERAAYNAYIDSEVKRRKALRAEMVRLGYDREDMLPEDLDQLLALFKEEFPDLYEDKE